MLIVVFGALILALLGASPYAQGWNDGSRFASVESLVDRGSWAIDDSIFVKVPQGELNPYRPDTAPDIAMAGTKDKLFISGHFSRL